jgi:hypothetical protein
MMMIPCRSSPALAWNASYLHSNPLLAAKQQLAGMALQPGPHQLTPGPGTLPGVRVHPLT